MTRKQNKPKKNKTPFFPQPPQVFRITFYCTTDSTFSSRSSKIGQKDTWSYRKMNLLYPESFGFPCTYFSQEIIDNCLVTQSEVSN